MKKEKSAFKEVDLSRYHILSYDELLKVNGGSGSESETETESESESETESESDPSGESEVTDSSESESICESEVSSATESETGGREIENSNEAVAGASVGDTLTRDDGTQVTITQGDIDWAQDYCNTHGISYGKTEEEAVNVQNVEGLVSEEENPSALSHGSGENQTVLNDEKNELSDTKTNSEKEETVSTETSKSHNTETSFYGSTNHSEKAGQSFFDTFASWLGSLVEDAKNTLCDLLGLGDNSKPAENAVVEVVPCDKNKVGAVDSTKKTQEQDAVKKLIEAQDRVMNNPLYREGSPGLFGTGTAKSTWCNQATFEISRNTALGLANAMYGNDRNGYNTNANLAAQNLREFSSNPNNSIKEVSGKEAQELANLGYTVVPAYENQKSTLSGHLATVRPCDEYNESAGPMLNNIGVENYTGIVTTLEAFGSSIFNNGEVHYYYDSNQF